MKMPQKIDDNYLNV